MWFIYISFIFFVIYRIIKRYSTNKKLLTLTQISVYSNQIYASDNKTKRTSNKLAQWHGLGQKVSVGGYEISDGLIYVGEFLPDLLGNNNDSCLINPKLKVLPSDPEETIENLGYWPQYENISEKCRNTYLNWLANGRSEPEIDIGYVFLYFYGLERRLFLEGQKDSISEKERNAITHEVNRLLGIYGNNRSFSGYASNFLAMEWIIYQNDKTLPSYINFKNRYCTGPFQVLLAQYVTTSKPIPADIALQWAMLHLEFKIKTPGRRCTKEFKELFDLHYIQQFGDGLIIKPNKTRLKLGYHAANPSLLGNLEVKIPDLPNPFILNRPLKKLIAIIEKCVNKLEAYSRYLGNKNNDPHSLSAMALLPKELINQASSKNKLLALFAEICEKGPGLLSINAIYECLEKKPPLQTSKKEAESLSILIDAMGFGMVPDIRFNYIKPDSNGQIAIFRHGYGVNFEPSQEFHTASIILRLGSIVCQADENISIAEEILLQNLIQNNRNLTGIEKDALLAFLYWCLRTPQATTGLKKKLYEINTTKKNAIRHTLFTVANADGYIDPKEIKLLEKLYNLLGFDKEQVIDDIHALTLGQHEAITVSLRESETIYSIPKQPVIDTASASSFSLNEELVKTLEKETQQVKNLLTDVFSDETEETITTFSFTKSVSISNPIVELDKAHQSLFHQLLTKEIWNRADLYKLCKELGLMADGAMEVLNEWAFNNANAPLIDDGESIYIDINLAKEIMNA